MPGKRVFYTDPYLTELETNISSSRVDEKGTWYSFDKTLFYPQGGGQSSDKGWINSERVVDVQSNGDVWHLLNSPISDPVSMKLDWNHRYTNMQQHTGQHILSACFKKFHDLDTISVHLGTDITMIELATAMVGEKVLDEVENSANQMIRDNLPIATVVVDRKELVKYTLRRRIKAKDDYARLVQIGDIDCVGCGGTHVRSTAEVGLIKILGAEKIRGHARVKIKIGSTAYQYFNKLHYTLHKVGASLTISIDDFPEKINSMILEKKDLINKKKHLTELWLSEYAKNLGSKSKVAGCFALQGLNKEHLKILSEQLLLKYGLPCILVSNESAIFHFYIRIPSDLNLNVQDFVEKYKSKYHLKGGGGKEFAVGQIDAKINDNFLQEQLFHSFKDFINERSDK